MGSDHSSGLRRFTGAGSHGLDGYTGRLSTVFPIEIAAKLLRWAPRPPASWWSTGPVHGCTALWAEEILMY
jgi:hypothetical protein